MQGIALIQENEVSMFHLCNLVVGVVIMIVGIGGNVGYESDFIPITIPGLASL
ncbi:MAG TPA: hypothetical protein VFQ13_22745 [Anaerolineales bacterium]|nr:hypothetical protein [Anaerolineales bacterium]